MCFRSTQNLQYVWSIAPLALNSATFYSPICVSLIRKKEPVLSKQRYVRVSSRELESKPYFGRMRQIATIVVYNNNLKYPKREILRELLHIAVSCCSCFLCARVTRRRSILKVPHLNKGYCAHMATSHERFSSSLETLANHRTM